MVNGTINIAAPWIRHGLYSIWVTSLPSHSMNPMRKSRFESAPEDHQFPWEDPLESCQGATIRREILFAKWRRDWAEFFLKSTGNGGLQTGSKYRLMFQIPTDDEQPEALPHENSAMFFFSPASPSICLDDIGGCFSRSQLSQLGQQVFRWKAIGTGDVRFQVPPKVLWLQPMDP